MYLCICKTLSDKQVREAIDQGDRTVGDLSARFGVGIACGKCIDGIRDFLDACLSEASSAAAGAPPATAAIPPPPTPVAAAPPRAAWFATDL